MNKLILLAATVCLSFSTFAHEGEGEEGNAAIGPTKGITEANEKDGFKLSPEALKTFAIKSVSGSGAKPVVLPRSAIFFGLQERNLFRLRDGFFKRIDFTVISKSNTEWTVSSADLRPGDRIVTDGVGFLRVVEIQASGGIEDEH